MRNTYTFTIASGVRSRSRNAMRPVITDSFTNGKNPTEDSFKLTDLEEFLGSKKYKIKNGNLTFEPVVDVVGAIKPEKVKSFQAHGSWFRKLGGDTSVYATIFEDLNNSNFKPFVVAYTGVAVILRCKGLDFIIHYAITKAKGKKIGPISRIIKIDGTPTMDLGYTTCVFLKDGDGTLYQPLDYKDGLLVDAAGVTAVPELSKIPAVVIIADGHVYDESLHFYNSNSSKFLALYTGLLRSKKQLKPLESFSFNNIEVDEETKRSRRYILNSANVQVCAVEDAPEGGECNVTIFYQYIKGLNKCYSEVLS